MKILRSGNLSPKANTVQYLVHVVQFRNVKLSRGEICDEIADTSSACMSANLIKYIWLVCNFRNAIHSTNPARSVSCRCLLLYLLVSHTTTFIVRSPGDDPSFEFEKRQDWLFSVFGVGLGGSLWGSIVIGIASLDTFFLKLQRSQRPKVDILLYRIFHRQRVCNMNYDADKAYSRIDMKSKAYVDH